jgi:jouberin
MVKADTVGFGHIGMVNSIVFDGEGARLYSGDSVGGIKVWALQDSNGVINLDCIKAIQMVSEFLFAIAINFDTKESGIRSFCMHQTNRKILVFLYNNDLHSLDVRIYRLMSNYLGLPAIPNPATENSIRFSTTSNMPSSSLYMPYSHIMTQTLTKAIYSPCGTHVYAGTIDGRIFSWKTESAELVHIFSPGGIKGQVVDIAFHPRDHYIAFSTWGAHQPVSVFTFDEDIGVVDGNCGVGSVPLIGGNGSNDKIGILMRNRVKGLSGLDGLKDLSLKEKMHSNQVPAGIGRVNTTKTREKKKRTGQISGFEGVGRGVEI